MDQRIEEQGVDAASHPARTHPWLRCVLRAWLHAGLSLLFQQVQPDECDHLAAASVIHFSVENEFATIQTHTARPHRQLGWQARLPFEELVLLMVLADLEGIE